MRSIPKPHTSRRNVTKKAVSKAEQQRLHAEGVRIKLEEEKGKVAVLLAEARAEGGEPSIVGIARKAGMSTHFVRGVQREMAEEHLPVGMAIRKITSKRMLEKAETIIDMSLEQVAKLVSKTNNLRDVSYALDRVFNMRQLLRGEPTAITTYEDRRQLNELLPALLKEAARRGIIIDGIARPVVDPEPQRGLPDSRVTIEEAVIRPADAIHVEQPA